MASSPPPPPPPWSQRLLENFDLPTDLKWSTKSQSSNNPTRGRWRRAAKPSSSSPSTMQQHQPQLANAVAANAVAPNAVAAHAVAPNAVAAHAVAPNAVAANAMAANASEQSSPTESGIIDWLHESLSKNYSGSSSMISTARPSRGQTNADSDIPVQPRDASPLRIKFSTSGTTSQKPSSFRPWHATKSGSSSGATSPLMYDFPMDDKETTCLDLLKSGFAVDNVDKGKNIESRPASFASEKMIGKFEETLSVWDIDEEEVSKQHKHRKEDLKEEKVRANTGVEINCELNKQELQFNTGKKEEKPLKTYVRNPKKKGQGSKEKKVGIVEPNKETDEDDKPVLMPEGDDSDDLDEKIRSLRTRKPNCQTGVLGSTTKDEGDDDQSAQKKKEKQIVEDDDGESKSAADDHDKKKNAKENNKKNKGKEAKREQQQTQPRFPPVAVQLTNEEISDDLFVMTGNRPPRKPQIRRPKNVQRHIDQLAPGSWLDSIDANRYKVNENTGRKGKKR